MLLQKYRARRAASKELQAHAGELEREYLKLRNPTPPSYDELYGGPSAVDRRNSINSAVTADSRSSSQSSR